MKDQDDTYLLKGLLVAAVAGVGYQFYSGLSGLQAVLFVACSMLGLAAILLFAWDHYSPAGRQRRARLDLIRELPQELLVSSPSAVRLGEELDLCVPIFLPDSVRTRHVHILGATGSGKTESVIMNLVRQDVARGHGSIILDAKGDASFLENLRACVPDERLRIFDLGSTASLAYDPLAAGSPLEAAQRLFASLTWSEEYYQVKAQAALQRLFQVHFEQKGRNPTLKALAYYLQDAKTYGAFATSGDEKSLQRDYADLSGLVAQIRSLSLANLSSILSPDAPGIHLEEAANGTVLYFRLQSLMSPQLVKIVGKLVINHLSYLAGVAHRSENKVKRFIPTYFDEFAAFACPEFSDLISKARSAGFALHYSHQSTGDVKEVSEGFLSQITDNSATKIVLRVSDPDTAEFFARSYGTKLYHKVTQRITNAKEIDDAEIVGEGTVREAHQFRAPPDLFKTLPVGVGSVLIAHGRDTPHGASSVLKIQFPPLSNSPPSSPAPPRKRQRRQNGLEDDSAYPCFYPCRLLHPQ